MEKKINFETYLVISHDKYEIFLLDIKNIKIFYQNEFKVENASEKINLIILNEFLETNIFKIEKKVGSFVNNLNVIIEDVSILNFDISIKKKNYSGNVNKIFLENILTDVNDLFQENYNKYHLMHMLINKYIIDGTSYFLPKDNVDNDEICLEIKLISISNLIVSEIESILKKYQIQVNHYFDKSYVKDISRKENLNISQMAHKLLNGINNNEVRIIPKLSQKLGFFEKFFQLFS